VRRPNLAIDGLAASGKTTVARQLAERLGLFYLDTGLMYRSVALQWHRAHQGIPTEADAGPLLARLDLAIQTRSEPVASCRMVLQGEDVTDLLHAPEISRLVSRVAAISAIRRDLVRRQQEFARQGGVVMVGRDIATVVMPDAELKIFLVAELHVRAQRRLEELGAGNLEEVTRDLAERDRIDTERADSPLICVPEAHRVDTTSMTPEEVLHALAALVARVA
jgi:cytidylate kinase